MSENFNAAEPEELPPMRDWLRGWRSETKKAQYAYLILKRYVNCAGLEIKKTGEITAWSDVGWILYLNIDESVRRQEHTDLLKALLTELTDFCPAAFPDYFPHYLLQLIEKFVVHDPAHSPLAPHLPAKAWKQFDEIRQIVERNHQAEREMWDQMGY